MNTTRGGTVYYDGTCPFCLGAIRRFTGLLASRNFRAVPYRIDQPIPGEMAVVDKDGTRYGGAEAIIYLAGQFWWARPFALLGKVPVINQLLHRIYQRIAAARHCKSGACHVEPDRRYWPLVLIIFPVFVMPFMPAFLFMWVLAATVFLACKLCVLPRKMTLYKKVQFLFCWPGMNPQPFMVARKTKALGREWLMAGAKVFIGFLLFFQPFALLESTTLPLRIALFLAGYVLMLHSGLFDLMALFWRGRGVRVQKVMNRPLAALRLRELWTRWNHAFSEWAEHVTYRPLLRWFGPGVALYGTFFISGLLHDLVMSLPAKGGWGLPTLYFLIQALGIHVEESRWGGWMRGRLWTIIVALVPLPLLVHQPFMENILMPFFDLITGNTAL
ncbi:MAG: DCC1-like thiol-disulfide oxidoreductase family protein [Verrucomicrobiota bacterium]|nr:DCC1-like thiol-disulfide oxidoreductase family protein [Verrucomicrobiota bacterium]